MLHVARGFTLVGLGAVTVVLSIAAGATVAAADEVRFSLTLDYELLQAAIRKHLHEQGGALEIWRTADGCGTFVLHDPAVEPADGRLRISGRGSASAGLYLFGWCLASVSWDGHTEILARPEIGPDWQLRLRDPDMQLYDATRRRRGVATRLFSVVKNWADAELGTFAFNLGPPVQELRALLASFAGSVNAGPLVAALQTVRPLGVTAESEALKVALAVDLPPVTAAPRAPEPALTPAQLRRWEVALEGWDSFLAFVIKDLGGANPESAERNELLDLLLTARRDLVAVLGRGPEPGVDPVRALFFSTWERLRAILRRTAIQRGNESRALHYVIFLAAGDALAAIEAAAPAAGLEISADGLRRLARTLDPSHLGDPLEYSDAPDPRLQQLFRFRDPDAPPRPPRRRPSGGSHWLAPRSAHAQEVDEWRTLAARLDRWVPTNRELGAYLDTVERLLVVAAERTLDPDVLDERFDDLFRHLVKAVAWQESCWRQFVRRGDTATYLISPTGDVGIMQINVRIWRGFFNADKLRWSATYNAGAGAEILQHMLVRYGAREAGDGLENAARATYGAYNGGPARYRRYRSVPLQGVDRAFWEKYQAVAAGVARDRVLCLPPGSVRS